MKSSFSFSNTPVIRHSRSRFDLSHGVKTTANVGTLYPFELQEVYAGDTFKVRTSCVTRLTSQFFRPVMDNLFLDVYYFFVPSRLLYDKYVNIMGENTESAWANTVDYDVPQVPSSPSGARPSVYSKTVADYLGLPVGALSRDVSILPFRAFAKVYNEWFRDQNNVPPMHIQTGESTTSERLNNNVWSPSNYTGKLPNVARMHDYFSSCLPSPQKGEAVDIPLGGFSDVPVYSGATMSFTDLPQHSPLALVRADGSAQPSGWFQGFTNFTGPVTGYLATGTSAQSPAPPAVGVTPVSLHARTSDLVSPGFSVNDLRFAFQYQKMLERDARGGTRYVEYLASHFGVSAGDYRLQRSEFLGGRRSPISITQVTQTTGSNDDSAPLGQVGAFSLSNSSSRFTKGFVEHGYVLGVFCIRQFHTYQQGIERFWTRNKRTDFYDPVFANIGEQPVYQSELYGVGSAVNEKPFGYNEAWADLRYRPSHITGQMRSGVTNSLDFWHFGDVYENAPTLTPTFIQETPEYVDRAITVKSSQLDQFILDFYIQNIAYRPLPTYSVPSLIDHN